MSANPTSYHQPVLLAESLSWLAIDPAGTYVDATFGGGGHSRAILERLGPAGRLFAFDQDADAHANTLVDSRFTLLGENFRHLSTALQACGVAQVDGILADLGVSSHQFDEPARGFSFRADAALDMRMDATAEHTAADILNAYPEAELVRIFRDYGELPQPRRVARTLVAVRQHGAILRTGQLVEAVRPLLPRKDANTVLAQLFQALRIEVNDEIGALHQLLTQSLELLRPGGRLVVIAYHSLEDRPVKHLFATGNLQGVVHTDLYGNRLNPWHVLTRKPVVPSAAEVAANPRARSAKLRAAAKQPVPQQETT